MRQPYIYLFFSIVLSLYGFIFFYIFRRFIRPLEFSSKKRRWAGFVLFLLILSTFIPFLYLHNKWPYGKSVSWFGYMIFGFLAILLPLAFVRDFIFSLVRLWRPLFTLAFYTKTKWQEYSGPKKSLKSGKVVDAPVENSREERILDKISRKDFLIKSNYSLLGFSVALGGYGAYEARKPPRVYQNTIPIAGLPAGFNGFKIAQISDIHVGWLIDRKYLDKVVEKINELSPDAVVITGDLVDGSVGQLREAVSCLKDLYSPCGTYFVTGNHEYYSGVNEWIRELERLGVKVLMNNHDVIRQPKQATTRAGSGARNTRNKAAANLIFAGVPDHREGVRFGHAYEPAKAVQNTKASDIKVLLAHQPVAIEQTVHAGYHLQLSGHTHGGQFFPYNYLVGLVYPYSAGLYHHEEKLWVYVNRGTGYWGPPLRIGVPSEISLHHLVAL